MQKYIIEMHHRSKERIKDFGEVFTPEIYVHQMLDQLGNINDKNQRGW